MNAPVKKEAFATALARPDEEHVEVLQHARGSENVEALLALARQHEIPIMEDFALSSALRRLPPGALIPEEVFQAVAILLDFLLTHEQELQGEDPASPAAEDSAE